MFKGKKALLSFVIVFTAGAFLFAGCDQLNGLMGKKSSVEKAASAPASAVKGPIVAKVNNLPITLVELNEDIDFYNNNVPADKPEMKITTRDQKLNYLKNELVRRDLLYLAAMDRGLDRDEEVVSALEKAKMGMLVVELVKKETDNIDVSSKEIEDYYNTYKEQLKEPEERQIREIVVPMEQDAKEVLIQLLQGADFATLAKDKSKSASAKDGGDLGFIGKGKKSAQFDTVAFSDSLEVGKISNIFKDSDGYYVLKLEARRGGKVKSLSEMWDDIKRGLTFLKKQKKIDELIGKLSSQAKIEVYEGEIK